MTVWSATEEVFELVEKIKNYHHVRLVEANIAVCFVEAKAFVGDRFNFGKTSKFSLAAKVWHPDNKRYDFLITIPSDSWEILNDYQKEALVDLHLCSMTPEYEVETVEENGKKKPVKDKLGRTIYTNVPKLDKEGSIKWKLYKLDIEVVQDNVVRYGCWCDTLQDLKSVINHSESCKTEVQIEEIQ